MMSKPPKDVLKYCPRCGSDHFIVEATGRSFRCEECRFHYFINSSAAVAAIIQDSQGRILMGRRAFDPNKGALDLPGGFVDPGETAEMALYREIKEELNLNVSKAVYLTSAANIYPFSGINIYTTDMAFLVEVENLASAKPADDIMSIEFYHPDEIIIDDLYSESMKQILQFYIQKSL